MHAAGDHALSSGDARRAGPGPQRSRIARISVALACLLGVDVVAGSLLEALGSNPAWRKPDLDFRVAHVLYHHDLEPNVDVLARWGEVEYTMRTNSLGFRSASVTTVAPRSSKWRLLVMGDSFAEGVGVEYEETFVAGLALRLAARNVEVLNAGVVSYSPSIYLRKTRFLVEDGGLIFDAMLVLLDISDIADEAVHYRIAQDGAVLREREGNPRDAVLDFVERNTVALSSLRTLIRRLREGRTPRSADALDRPRALWTHDELAWRDYGERGLARATARMNELADFLGSRGIGLAVAIYPWPDQIVLGDLESRQVRHWRAWAGKRNAHFVDLFPSFIDERAAGDVLEAHFIAGDVHWNARGHALVARAISEQLPAAWRSSVGSRLEPPSP